MKKNHKNDKRRITATERVNAWYKMWAGQYSYLPNARKMMIKMLGDHVKAAHKRHARTNVCLRGFGKTRSRHR